MEGEDDEDGEGNDDGSSDEDEVRCDGKLRLVCRVRVERGEAIGAKIAT